MRDAFGVGIKRFAMLVAAVTVMSFAALGFTACDEGSDSVQTDSFIGAFQLYAVEEGDDGYYYAWFSVAQIPEVYAECECVIVTKDKFSDVTGADSELQVVFDAGEAADTVLGYTASQSGLGGVTRDNLKIVFEYGTIYESFKSNGVVTEADGLYYHTLTVGPDDGETVFEGRIHSFNPSAWYALLITAALIVLAVAAVAIVLIGRRKWRKKTM